MTRRNLVHISREPMQLSDVTIQPVLFTVLFIYIFGGGIPIPHGSYKDFALAGLLALNLVTSTMGTAVGLSTDLHGGIIDRFRALPMWQAAVLVGRSFADLMTSCICALIVAVTGLAVGWRPDAGAGPVIGGFALVLFFAYSLSWIAACVGLNSKSPESAASFGFIVLFPLAFVSNAMVPTQHMPGWLQAVADWNPVSAVTAGARELWGNPNPSAAIHAWPMQHPVCAALIWSALILAIAAPLASYFFRRRSDGEQAELVNDLLAGYRLTLQEDRRSLFDHFTEVDAVRQVVGVGSVGMQVYLVLLEGRTGADPLFLQAKQAGPSVYEAHTQPSRHDNHGARVINGKRLVQSATDIFAGCGSLHGKDYYVRQFRDMKIIPTTELIAPRLVEFATACGETLARAHARTGDPAAIDAYIGKGPKFAAAIGRFAGLYADQNERDHAQLVGAIAAGAVESRPRVKRPG